MFEIEMEANTQNNWIYKIGITFLTMAQLFQCDKIRDINVARQWLHEYNIRAMDIYSMAASAKWEYNTNLTDYNQQRAVSILAP